MRTDNSSDRPSVDRDIDYLLLLVLLLLLLLVLLLLLLLRYARLDLWTASEQSGHGDGLVAQPATLLQLMRGGRLLLKLAGRSPTSSY